MKNRFDELAVIWFKKAQDDVLWVKHDFKGKFYGVVCFGCQQIAEKALKAYLFYQRERLIRTHNLVELLRSCSKHNTSFKKLIKACKILNDYYIDTRYPSIWDNQRFNDKKLASEALDLAEQVLNFIKKQIK